MMDTLSGAVFAQTNEGAGNAVAAFGRAADGTLSPLGSFATGGRGNGTPHLPSQGSVVAAADGRRLLVVNAGSDDVSVFDVRPDGLALLDCAPSGGPAPTSVAVHGDLVYVLNRGDGKSGGIAGFRLGMYGKLTAVEGSALPLTRTRPTARRSRSAPTAQRSSSRSASPTGSARTSSATTAHWTARSRTTRPARRRTASTSPATSWSSARRSADRPARRQRPRTS